MPVKVDRCLGKSIVQLSDTGFDEVDNHNSDQEVPDSFLAKSQQIMTDIKESQLLRFGRI